MGCGLSTNSVDRPANGQNKEEEFEVETRRLRVNKVTGQAEVAEPKEKPTGDIFDPEPETIQIKKSEKKTVLASAPGGAVKAFTGAI